MLPATQNDVLDALKQARDREEFPLVYQVLDQLLENADIAAKERIPICQDCGFVVVRARVRPGYSEGYLCNFIVSQPFSAGMNTRDNIPAVFYYDRRAFSQAAPMLSGVSRLLWR